MSDDIEQREKLIRFDDLLYGKGQRPPAGAPGGAPGVAAGGAGRAGTGRGAGWTSVRLVVLADASGSMAPYQQSVRDGLGSFFERLDPKVPYIVTLIQFNYTAERLAYAMPIANLIAARAIDRYSAMGGTALWDALWAGLEAEGPATDPVLCIIATDGEDTASTRSLSEAASLCRERAGSNWSFLWLNMYGPTSPYAAAIGAECLDFRREDIVQVLIDIAGRVSRAVERARLTGARRLPALLSGAGKGG